MAELALELDFCKTAWPMRKGYRHFLDGRDTSGRSSYSKSVASKWLHRLESCEHATARMAHSVAHRHKHSQQKSDACRTKSKRYKSPREPESWMMSSGREALDWESFDHSFLEFHDSDDLSDWDSGSESTCSGISGSTCSSCSTSSNASSKSEKSELEPTRWEMAQRVAASTAAAYRKLVPARPKAVKSPPKVKKPQQRIFSTVPRVQASVSPPFPEAHAAALEFAKGEESEQSLRTGKHFGRGKPGQPKRQKLEQIDACSPEYEAITRYFQQTLSREPEIHSLSRITQQGVQQRFMSNGDNTLMFHGCRSVQNYERILSDGFQTSRCCSGGAGYGTWFAYNASYSDGGYAHDAGGWKHLFVCVVSNYYTVLDNTSMRVVGQDCAYPQWVIKYRFENQRLPSSPLPAKPTSSTKGRTFYVVRDGQWVPEGGQPG
ncbi:unnamed protein product [Effrenium voratum]|uniref:PARP catalytic domain-containing protein n=1 Tax=Effrenium voratum TaxID=2562239 RepID=A0AA36HSD6_9DINO|nr:unnamed protein product [Effrenium voratum]CAJ1442107.1 unnamed protein product [Effrenium voratum]